MNKLQKLFNSNIGFTIGFSKDRQNFGWVLDLERKRHRKSCTHGTQFNLEAAIHALWLAAKEYYPDAECFKEEREEG